MRNTSTHTSEFELLPSDVDLALRKEQQHDSDYPRRKPIHPSQLWKSPIARYITYTIPLLMALTPVILLLAYSPKLSHQLGINGCTPSGEFVLPATTSIWDPKRFFAITISFLGPGSGICKYDPYIDPSCIGYDFTQVKIIDISWDILVGRGLQAVLILFAYKIFGRVVKGLMSRGEVGYDLFSAVAFDSGGAMSFITILRHAAGWTPIPRTRRAMLIYAGMAAGTLHIVIVSSLVAAMTGYTSFYEPSLEMETNQAHPDGGAKICNGHIAPVWGEMQGPHIGGQYPSFDPAPTPIMYTEYDYNYYDFIGYYNQYSKVYDTCPKQFNLSKCVQAQQETYVEKYNSARVKVLPPMPGIIPYAESSTTKSTYTHWLCGNDIFKVVDQQYMLFSAPHSPDMVGTCRAGNGYAWGFSFLLTFVTSVLNLIFTILMYMLWLEVRRSGTANDVGTVKDAVTLVTLAQKQYGAKIGDWSSHALQREIVAGKAGMSFVDDMKPARRRKLVSRDEQEYGDPRAGDWGGEVYVSDTR